MCIMPHLCSIPYVQIHVMVQWCNRILDCKYTAEKFISIVYIYNVQ